MPTPTVSRRTFLGTSLAATALPALPALAADPRPQLLKAVKFGTLKTDLDLVGHFRLLKELGFDGVETSSPTDQDLDALKRASEEAGLPIHGVVNSIHWRTRLSDPDPAVRERSRQGLETAIRDSHRLGGTSVLLVPGRVSDPERENQEQVWERSIEQIRLALPLAEELGIHILIENVWNGFCYIHDGPDNQTAEQLAAYLDAIASPLVGSYFDIGNHQKYGRPADWIRTLGKRIVKLDVKDWGKAGGFVNLGEGDVDWPAVRQALVDIGFSGWATAEVRGGPAEFVRENISLPMDRLLLGR